MSTLDANSNLEAETMRRVSWRLMPFLLLAYLICYIDRVNVGFAALQMNKAVGLDPKTYGLGAGIFFVGYFIFEVPSNLALEKFGARRWIARIMISWGIISMACAFIAGPFSFLSLQFLLGVAEAGFFPGVILYLTYWYPARYRAIIIGIFMVAIPAAGFIGSPLSGAILYLDGWLGVAGWQWIFILEAAPAVLLGFAAYLWLTDKPQNAAWLSPAQQQWLATALEAERRRAVRVEHQSVWRVISNRYVLIMALVYSGAVGASTSLALWMPQLVKSFGLSNWETGLVTAVPFGIAAVWMVLWGRCVRPKRRARLAQCIAAGLDGRCDAADVLCDRQPVGDDPAAHADRSRHLCEQGTVLGAEFGMARHGCRRSRACPDQCPRQPLGFLLQLDDRLDSGNDRQLPARDPADRNRGVDRNGLRAGDRAPPAAHRRDDTLSRNDRRLLLAQMRQRLVAEFEMRL